MVDEDGPEADNQDFHAKIKAGLKASKKSQGTKQSKLIENVLEQQGKQRIDAQAFQQLCAHPEFARCKNPERSIKIHATKAGINYDK